MLAEEDSGTVDVTPEDAADWIVRSALPRFLDLLTLTDDAEYFYGLEPFKDYTPTGRLRGWQGAGVRLAAAEDAVNVMYRNLLGIRNRFSEHETTEAEKQARGACVFARRVMLPSRIGWTAYRVIGTASRLAKHAAETAGEGPESIEDAWQDAFDAIADRARLRPYLTDADPGR